MDIKSFGLNNLLFLKKLRGSQASVAHAYNPSYLGGRD
jgi:hypothetical protein